MSATRILLVVPAFHGYGRSIAGALERAGHSVLLHEYDLNATRSSKLRHKLVHELPDRVSGGVSGSRRHANQMTAAAAAAVTRAGADVVLTVKGDALGGQYWRVLDASGARQLLWLYDELSRMEFDDEILTSRPSIVSYSPHDVAVLSQRGLRAAHVLDAFDHTVTFMPIRSDEVVFVGARYPDRERILNTLHRAGVPVRAYGRDWSGHPIDRLRTWRLHSPQVPSARDVPRGIAYGITAGAVASLNSHTDQDGFTMRTYEIPGSGGLQLIDRPDVDQIYDPGEEVLVFSSDEELVELSQRARTDRAWATQVAERGQKRTLAEHTFDHRVPALEAAWD
jgi:spore maturation protein CgeB